MQVALHTGAHFTDDDKLLKSLAKNTEMFAERGISLPKPRSYRADMRSTLGEVQNAAQRDELRARFLDNLVDKSVKSPDRILMSHSNFFGVPKIAIRQNMIYPDAAERLLDFCNIFEQDEVEIFLAIRNPATFLPAMLGGTPCKSIDDLTNNSIPTALRWSELVTRIRAAVPQASLTVWCNEDTPLLWEELLREMAGLDATQPIEGGNDLLDEIMSKEGMSRYQSYIDSHPGMTEMQKRRVIAAFLDKFALDDELEEELDIPGWTEDFIDALTEIYDEDLYEMSRLPGVNLIMP